MLYSRFLCGRARCVTFVCILGVSCVKWACHSVLVVTLSSRLSSRSKKKMVGNFCLRWDSGRG